MSRFQVKNIQVNRPLLLMFSSNLAVLFVGMGVFPLLPFYVQGLGASPQMTGLFLATIYLFNAAGPLLNGWLVGRVSRRVVFVAAGAPGIPALALMGQVEAFWAAILLSSIVWFSGGVLLAITSAYTGLHAKSGSLGKSFSFMAIAGPLGSLLGGAAAGSLVARQGFGGMFAVMALVWALLPAIGWLALDDTKPRQAESRPASGRQAAGFGKVFYVLIAVSVLSAIAINLDRLGISLFMQFQNLPPATVGSATTVSGLLAVPVTLLLGSLSDRLGYKRFLGLAYLLAAAGALTLVGAEQVWQFWLAASLILVAFSANGALAPALLSNRLGPEKLERGLSWMNAANSAAGILSFAGSGYGIEAFGLGSMYMGVGLLAVSAAAVLELIPEGARNACGGLVVRAESALRSLWTPARWNGLEQELCR